MRGKVGSAHFEMIVGFVFFIGFIFFLFLFLSPMDNSSLPRSAIEKLYISFSNEVETNLSSVFVKTNYTGSNTCFKIDLPVGLFKYAITDEDSLVRLLGGNNVDSGLVSGGELNLRDESDFFRVAISPEFSDSSLSSCDSLTDFELGGIIEIKIVSNSSLTAMRDKYYSDYAGLKSDLKVADIFDFAIIPEEIPDLVMKPVGGIPDSVEVMARDYVVKILNVNGEISNERISMRLW